MSDQLITKSSTDRKIIHGILEETRELMGGLVRDRRRWISPDLWNVVAEAWEKLEPRFEKGAAELEGRVTGEQLELVGLSGEQLQMSALGLQRAVADFRKKPSSETLSSVLEWVNWLLMSLEKPLPILAGVRDFKDAFWGLSKQVSDSGH